MAEQLNSQRFRRYKGNLHLHTTNSDGKLSPSAAVDWYRRQGYDFVSVTDHRRLSRPDSFVHDGILCIPGIELDVDRTPLGMSWHLVGLGVSSGYVPLDTKTTLVQPTIDHLTADGAIVILAHPYWSGLTVNEMSPLDGITGVEVYNTSCDSDLGKALSSVHWDDALAWGKQWWGLATDDTHIMDDSRADNDAGGGWVMVEAPSLSDGAILEALRSGRFYASSGPDIDYLSLDGDVLTVRCSPVRSIDVIGAARYGQRWQAAPGDTLTGATYRLKGPERYVRVECTDAQGKKAWSNPFFTSGRFTAARTTAG